jgi:hypothetical protein
VTKFVVHFKQEFNTCYHEKLYRCLKISYEELFCLENCKYANLYALLLIYEYA